MWLQKITETSDAFSHFKIRTKTITVESILPDVFGPVVDALNKNTDQKGKRIKTH